MNLGCSSIFYQHTNTRKSFIDKKGIRLLTLHFLTSCELYTFLFYTDTTNSANLTKFGRDKVIYDALVKVLSAEDAAVMRVSAVPLAKVLGIMCAGESRVTVSQVDHFMEKLLSSIELETKVRVINVLNIFTRSFFLHKFYKIIFFI